MTASTGKSRFRATGIGVLAAILAGWIVLSVFAVTRQGTWTDEAGYIIKSRWFVSGAVKPYTAEDATWYQPLIFYALGAWQRIFGHGIVSSRALSWRSLPSISDCWRACCVDWAARSGRSRSQLWSLR